MNTTPPGLEAAFREISGSLGTPTILKALLVFIVHLLVWLKTRKRGSIEVIQ